LIFDETVTVQRRKAMLPPFDRMRTDNHLQQCGMPEKTPREMIFIVDIRFTIGIISIRCYKFSNIK
jgi:hypothetical protein